MLEPRGFATYRQAAVIYRTARAKGIALTTIDTLIAAIALEHRASVFTLDQDFSRIARITATTTPVQGEGIGLLDHAAQLGAGTPRRRAEEIDPHELSTRIKRDFSVKL